LYPQYRDFIDGRANTLFDTALLHEYTTVSTVQPGWQAVLAHWHVGSVLIESSSPLAAALVESPGWRRVYRDDVAAVFAATAPTARN
jgi:hypothetical protein